MNLNFDQVVKHAALHLTHERQAVYFIPGAADTTLEYLVGNTSVYTDPILNAGGPTKYYCTLIPHAPTDLGMYRLFVDATNIAFDAYSGADVLIAEQDISVSTLEEHIRILMIKARNACHAKVMHQRALIKHLIKHYKDKEAYRELALGSRLVMRAAHNTTKNMYMDNGKRPDDETINKIYNAALNHLVNPNNDLKSWSTLTTTLTT